MRTTISKTITISETTLSQIEDLVKEKRIDGVSLSFSIRSIVQQFYNGIIKTPYKYESLNKDKVNARKEQDLLDSIPEYDYVTQGLKTIVLSNSDNVQFAILHWIGNSFKAIPLIGIKKWVEENPIDAEFHLAKIVAYPLPAALTPYSKNLLTQSNGIIFPPDEI